MRRTRHDVFAKASTTRYVVLWDMHRTVIECQRIAAGADLRACVTAAIEQYRVHGWQPEGPTDFGFVFLSRGNDRRLLALTERNPQDEAHHSFNPHRQKQ
jgi:hypothetical protein